MGGIIPKIVKFLILKKKVWETLPDLNKIRENPSCCIINDKCLYCFFGYDNKSNAFHNTIEKINLKSKKKWEVIEPNGQQVHMKRKAACCLNYNHNGKDYIFIIGGINALKNECNDCLIYNEKENKIERKNNSLPFKCSFMQNSFNFLCSGYYANFTVDSYIIQYEQLGEIFFGIREKK